MDPRDIPPSHLLTPEQAAWVREHLIRWCGWPSQWPLGIGDALDPTSAAPHVRAVVRKGTPGPIDLSEFDDEEEEGAADGHDA